MTVGTVTAQLLYEIGGPRYLSPDAVARFDTIELAQEGARPGAHRGRARRGAAADAQGDGQPRRRLAQLHDARAHRRRSRSRRRGSPPTPCGPGSPAAAAAFAETAEDLSGDLSGGGMAYLRLAVRGDDEPAVGRAFSGAVVETSLSSYPGTFFTSAPAGAQGVARYWPTTVAASAVTPRDRVRGDEVAVTPHAAPDRRRSAGSAAPAALEPPARPVPPQPSGRRPSDPGAAGGPASAPARATRAATPTSASGPTRTTWPSGCWRTSRPRPSGRSCPSWPRSRWTATRCPTCGRSTSSCTASSAGAWPRTCGSTPRPRASANCSAPAPWWSRSRWSRAGRRRRATPPGGAAPGEPGAERTRRLSEPAAWPAVSKRQERRLAG